MAYQFSEIKEALIALVKPKQPCAEQYNRALHAETEDELLKVISDNISWCIENDAITNEFLSMFTPEITLKYGVLNTGKENTGIANSGNWNSGNWNSGDRNSGDSNSGYRNSGAFCTDQNPPLILFNKVSKMTVREWESHPACQLMYSIDPTIWVPANIMSDEEKEAHPKWETTEGYLKTITMHEAWANFWHNLSDEKKALFTTLENFDAGIFHEITGITL